MKYSIVIPCFNEAAHIQACLESLHQLNYPKEEFEIIVVDNGSSDGSDTIAKPSSDRFLSLPSVNVGEVRNQGATLASGSWLIFVDADCVLDSAWLMRADSLTSQSDETTVYGGGCSLPGDSTWVERQWLLEGENGNTLPKALIGCSIVIKKQLFHEIKGFDPTLKSGEDSELTRRLTEHGATIHITRELNVTHLGNAKTLFEFMKRQIWHGQSYRGNFKTNIKDPVYLLVILYPTALALSVLALVTTSSLLFSAFSMAWLSIPGILTAKRYLRARKKPRAWELPLAYLLDATYLTGRAWALFPWVGQQK